MVSSKRKRAGLTGTDNPETLTGTPDPDFIDGRGGQDTIFGLGGDDSLAGGQGDDILDGGVGADTLAGNDGNDSYFIDSPDDRVVEAGGQGSDRLSAADGFVLTAGAEVEQLEPVDLAGTQSLQLTGNEFARGCTAMQASTAWMEGATPIRWSVMPASIGITSTMRTIGSSSRRA